MRHFKAPMPLAMVVFREHGTDSFPCRIYSCGADSPLKGPVQNLWRKIGERVPRVKSGAFNLIYPFTGV